MFLLQDKLSAAIQLLLHMHCAARRFDILQEVATAADDSAGPEAALQIVHQLLSETLYILHELLVAGGQSLVLPITQVLIRAFNTSSGSCPLVLNSKTDPSLVGAPFG